MYLTVITSESCGHCKKAISQLRDTDIEYEVYDIRKARALIQRYGVNGVPFFILKDDNDNVIRTWRGVEPLFSYLEGGLKMKKLKFNTRVRDKETKEIYDVGAIKNFPNKRADEILATGYAEVVENTTPKLNAVAPEGTEDDSHKEAENKIND